MESVRVSEAQHHEHQDADGRREAEQHRSDSDPARIGLELELGQVDLAPDELRDVADGERDQVTERLPGAYLWLAQGFGHHSSIIAIALSPLSPLPRPVLRMTACRVRLVPFSASTQCIVADATPSRRPARG